MKWKMATILLAMLTIVSMFAVIQVKPVSAMDEDELYYWVSQLSVKVYDWQNNQWVYRETRDFKYKTSWYAEKFHYGYGIQWDTPVLKWNGKYYNESYPTYVTGHSLVVGMEGAYWGLDCAFDDLILCINGNIAPNGKKQIYIDAILGGATPFRLKVMYQGNVIFDYPYDKQKVAQQFGWCFYDTLFPEVEIPGDGSWTPPYDSETSVVNEDPSPVHVVARKLGMQVYSFNGSDYVCSRFHYQNRSVNPNKWWLKWFSIFTYNCDTYYYQKAVIGCDDFNEDNKDKDNYIDFVMVITYFIGKAGEVEGKVEHKVEALHTTGGLKRKLFYYTLNNQWVLKWQYMSWSDIPYAYNILLWKNY